MSALPSKAAAAFNPDNCRESELFNETREKEFCQRKRTSTTFVAPTSNMKSPRQSGPSGKRVTPKNKLFKTTPSSTHASTSNPKRLQQARSLGSKGIRKKQLIKRHISRLSLEDKQFIQETKEMMQGMCGQLSEFLLDVNQRFEYRLRQIEGPVEAESAMERPSQRPMPPHLLASARRASSRQHPNVKSSWAVKTPLCLRLSQHPIGGPDDLLSPRPLLLNKHLIPEDHFHEQPRQTKALTRRKVSVNLSETTPSSRHRKKPIDNPTSFFKFYPGPALRLWPCVSIERIRDKSFLSSCNDKVLLKLLSRYIMEHALDQLARCDVSHELEPRWLLTEKNLYSTGSRDLLRQLDCQLGEACSCTPQADWGMHGNRGVQCGDTLCENRAMNIECVPGKCGGGEFCKNSRIQKKELAKVELQKFAGKGYGLVASETIRRGTMIGEYLGDVITRDVFAKRMARYQGEHHFYFMVLTCKLVIDASRRASITRFINHSCDPNCETEKWNAAGEPHVAIVATRDIKPMEEITFSYDSKPVSTKPRRCLCGSSNCRQWLTPLPVTRTKNSGRGVDEQEDVGAVKIRQANSDIFLAEQMLRKVYDME